MSCHSPLRCLAIGPEIIGLESSRGADMKNRSGLWLSAVYLVLASWAFSQAPPDARQEIEQLEEQARQAASKGDMVFVEKYDAADYVAIMANGLSHGKAEEIESRRMSTVTYQAIDVRERKIRIYGNTAICNTLASMTFSREEKGYRTSYYTQQTEQVRFTRVWVKQEGGWKIVSFQATRTSLQPSEGAQTKQ